MMNAAKAPRKQPTPAVVQPDPEPQPLPGPPGRESAPTSGGKKAPFLAAFGAEEEEEKPRRTLKPITYTEEEQKAAQRKSPPSAKEKAAAIKRLISKVPTEIKAVFSYNIDWKSFDEGGKGLRKKIQTWVEKKTAELLGVAEASMVDFIMSKLDEHISAKKMLEELLLVLDDEANPFVFKLYRMVIFETLKQAAGLQE
jgi:RNA-binding protein 25